MKALIPGVMSLPVGFPDQIWDGRWNLEKKELGVEEEESMRRGIVHSFIFIAITSGIMSL